MDFSCVRAEIQRVLPGHERAREDAQRGALAVPMHLRNAPTAMMKGLGYGKDYRYPHDDEGAVTSQSYLPDELAERIYYEPNERGYEVRIRESASLRAVVRRAQESKVIG